LEGDGLPSDLLLLPKGPRRILATYRGGDLMDTRAIPVTDLNLDLSNFRTVPQDSEPDAVQAIVSTR
jgi:hypothetical protein